jgi:hypothetical protein
VALRRARADLNKQRADTARAPLRDGAGPQVALAKPRKRGRIEPMTTDVRCARCY